MPQHKTIFQRYKLLPLVLAGVLFLALFTLIGLLLWSLIAFLAQQDVAAAEVVPGAIYLAGIFLAAALMTALIRGGTVFPAAVLSLGAAIATYLLADSTLITIGGAVLKSLISLFAGVLGFTLTKLYFIMRRRSEPRVERKIDLSNRDIVEPGRPAPEPAAAEE